MSSQQAAGQLIGALSSGAQPEVAAFTAAAPLIPAIMMMPLLMVSVLIGIIGIIVLLADSSKTPGIVMVLIAGCGVFAALHTINHTVSKNK